MLELVIYTCLNHASYIYTFCVVRWGDEIEELCRHKIESARTRQSKLEITGRNLCPVVNIDIG